jgi:hypothetical protein
MTYYVQVPGGKYVGFPDDMPREEALNALAEMFPPEQKTGHIAALAKGAEDAWRQTKAGFKSLTGDADEAAQQSLDEGKNSKYANQVSWDKVKEAYDKDGLLGGAKEAAGQLPYALEQNAANIGAMAGGARTGAMLGAAIPLPGTTAAGAVIGAFAPSFLQQLGGNVEQQKEQGQTVNTGNAVAAAVPQAALDVAGMAIPLGKNLVGMLLGKDVAAMIGKASGSAG